MKRKEDIAEWLAAVYSLLAFFAIVAAAAVIQTIWIHGIFH